jgi:outer membrane protein OmpA-like peptidoglycan-associated protein
MQEQEEDFQIDDIADCIERFDLAMERVEAVIDPTPIPEPTVKLPRLVFEVFFDFDSAEVTTEAKKNIAAFAAWVPSYKSPVVSVVGNADQSGGVNYNFELSQRRADAVVRELEALGVTVEGVFARGDQVPVIDRIDRAPERINRRVIMIVRES